MNVHAESKGKARCGMFAAALVAILVCCAVVPALAETDAAYDESFDISMRVGDTFSYEPSVNLEGTTITPSGSAMESGLSWDGSVMSGSFDESGEYSVVLDALWQHGDLQQTARQTIEFTVYDRIWFADGHESGSIAATKAYTYDELTEGTEVYTVSFRPGISTPTIQFGTPTVDNPDDVSETVFSWNPSTHTVEAAVDLDSSHVGQYTVTIPVSYDGDVEDTAQVVLTIVVAEDLAITSPAVFNTIVGSSNDTYTITTNAGPGVEIDYGATVGEAYQTLISVLGATVTFNLEAAGEMIGDSQNISFDMMVTASGDVDGDSADEDASMTVTVTIYPEMVFTTEPSISDVTASSSTGNPLDMVVSSVFSNADRVVYDWGDGSYSELGGLSGECRYTTQHLYGEAGTYTITITAYGADGRNVSAVYAYDANEGTWMDGPADEGDDGFLSEHGVLWIVFLIVLALCLILRFVVQVDHPVMLLLIVASAVLAAACFLTADFGLTEGWL